MAIIHQTAIVHPKAKIAPTVEIGPYCIIGENVELADNVKIMSHVVIDGITTVGEGTEIFPFAAIGLVTQDMKFKGEKSRLVIGKNNKIREYVTMHGGTATGRLETTVGNNCLFMISTHVAHDCIVGNNVIMANHATLAGHVEVGDFVIIGGLSAVRQFVRIGQHAIIGGMSGIDSDVIPYGNAYGERAYLEGLNLIGLKRRNFDREVVNSLREAYRALFLDDQETFDKRIEEVETKYGSNSIISEVIAFLRKDTSRAVCLPRGRRK